VVTHKHGNMGDKVAMLEKDYKQWPKDTTYLNVRLPNVPKHCFYFCISCIQIQRVELSDNNEEEKAQRVPVMNFHI
jgi:hypothetical protein